MVKRAYRSIALGRNRPPADSVKFHLRDYLDLAKIPPPPASFSYAPKAGKPLAEMYDNDVLGCCVPACMGHMEGVFTANAGLPALTFSSADIIAAYSAIGGYVPGDSSTDNGCDEHTALSYWKQTGFPLPGANKIIGWVSVDGSKPQEYLAALWLFENLMFGVELPDTWIDPFPSASGFIWRAEGPPNPENGHCFCAVGSSPSGLEIDTWGMLGVVTPGAVAKYATTAGQGELYAVLSPEIIVRASGKAPAGIDLAALQADLAAL